MQTFLPYSDFDKCAKCLDTKRLGKQRVEAWQILGLLAGKYPKSTWNNHPAVLMWKGFEPALNMYGRAICSEWISRGYVDNMIGRFDIHESHDLPAFIGNEKFHASHRSALLFKKYDYYIKFGWTEPAEYNYVWPTKI